MTHAMIREEQNIGVCAGYKEILDEILFLQVRRAKPLSASALHFIGIYRQAFHITVVSYGHHHHVVRDEVFHIEAATVPFDDGCATRIRISLSHFQGFLLDQIHPQFTKFH